MDIQRLTPAAFSAHRGTSFTLVVTGDDSLEIRLATIEELPRHPGAPRAEPFSLVFVGPAVPRLAQGIYRLRHPALGELDLFLVPIGYEETGGLRYEAVFN